MHLSVPGISNHHRQQNIITWHYDLSLPTTPSDCAVLQSQSQSLSSLSSHQNPSFHPPLSTPREMFKKLLHPKPIHPQVHINILEKKCCPMGCRTVRPRSPSGFFLKRRSKSLPVIFCVPRRAIASRHSDSILQEESCLEMFIIFKQNGDKDLWDLEDWNYRISLPWQHLDFFNPIHHRFPSANSQIVPFDLVRLLYWSPFLSSRISVRNLPQI